MKTESTINNGWTEVTFATLCACVCNFRENIWSILSSQSTDHTPSIALHDVKEIETWILRLLSAPVPVPGSTRIECELISGNIREPLLFALPDHTRFSLVDFPLHLPLELLGEWIPLICPKNVYLPKKLVSHSFGSFWH